jgi:hypothetical protein
MGDRKAGQPKSKENEQANVGILVSNINDQRSSVVAMTDAHGVRGTLTLVEGHLLRAVCARSWLLCVVCMCEPSDRESQQYQQGRMCVLEASKRAASS